MWRVDPGSQVSVFLRALASTVKDVLVRQYRDMLSLNDEELDKLASETSNERVYNIGCEELVGLFSAIKERAPNGSLLLYSAKIKAKKQHCTISEGYEGRGTRHCLLSKYP